MTKIPVSAITIRDRYRKDMGDLKELADDIKDIGLLQPVLVTKARVLIDGERRIRAVTSLGWDEIEVRVLDLANPLKGERGANLSKPFTVSEKVAIAQAIEEEEAIEAAKRLAATQAKPGRKVGDAQGTENFTQPKNIEDSHKNGRAKDKAAEAVGMSRPTLAKAQEVVEAAKADPANADLVAEMDATGKVTPAHKKLEERNGKAKNHDADDDPEDGERDFLGHLITDKCRDAFLSLAKFKELDGLTAQLQKQIDALSKSPGGEQLGRFLQATGSEAKTINKSEHLNALKRDLKGTRPYCVCPWCKGKGYANCKGCNGTAWVTKTTWDNADEMTRGGLAK